MFQNLKVYKCGKFYRIISIKLKTNNQIIAKSQKSLNDKKLKNNIIRAKNNIQNYALSNNFKYFITITINQKYDRYNLDILRLNFSYIIKEINRKHNLSVKYLIVPEQHKNGAWHFHGFLTEDIQQVIYYNQYGYKSIKELENLGFHNIDEVRSIEKCSNYVTKYISKNLGDNIEISKHSYFASKGLLKPQLVEDIIYNNEYFNNKFFEFKNDFCYVKTIPEDEYYNFVTLLKNSCNF